MEVIVVAVIVAILAAVAVPIYLNYVTSSRNGQANNISGSLSTFCGACGVDLGLCAVTTNGTATSPGVVDCNQNNGVGGNNSSAVIPTGFSVTINAPTAAAKGEVITYCFANDSTYPTYNF